MRVQLALNVKDLDQAVEFYSKLFDAKAAKRRPGYANFALQRPALKLILIENPDASERINHLGVETFSADELEAESQRIQESGLEHRIERDTDCCYAVQNKIWTADPQGLPWEWYQVLADSPPVEAASCC